MIPSAHTRPAVTRPVRRRVSLAVLALLSLSAAGCASVFEGTSQDIAVNTNPVDASCEFFRQGIAIGTVPHTPGRLTVRKTKHDITVKCNKEGYQEASYINHSGTTATIAANVAVDLLLTAGLSSVIDSASGADNKYDSVVNLSLTPLPAPDPVSSSSTASVAP